MKRTQNHGILLIFPNYHLKTKFSWVPYAEHYLKKTCMKYYHLSNRKLFQLLQTSYVKKIYSNLIHEQALAVSPTSPVETFNVSDENFPNVFYIYKVTYYLNLSFPTYRQDLFTEILNPDYFSSAYAEEALALWKEIAIAECVEYLQYQLGKVGFDFSPGDKTHKTFEIIL